MMTGCAWKLGRSFLATTRRASDACLRRVYDEPKSHLFLVHFSVLFLAIIE